jgi:putative sterol carrier protein
VHRFAALIIASAVAITPAQAQTTSELSISGTVEKLGGNLVALSLSQGISVVVRLDSEPRVNSVAKGSGSDLKAGSQVSIQAKSGQSGDLVATQIVLFAPGSNRPDAEPGPDNAQLVATIKKTDASPEGPVLIIPDKDKDRKITIGPDTAIWIARAARIADIKVGSAADAQKCDFVITAPYSRWKQVATKELDATKGMLQGKLKLKGDLPTIVRYTKASQEMTECTTRIPVEWPDEATR